MTGLAVIEIDDGGRTIWIVTLEAQGYFLTSISGIQFENTKWWYNKYFIYIYTLEAIYEFSIAQIVLIHVFIYNHMINC